MKNSNILKVRNKVRIPILGKIDAEFITFHGLENDAEHIMVGLGDWENTETPLVRIHSECLTGDVFGSRLCDCGPQLHESAQRIKRHGGFIIYLRQEGRGIGLFNKLDAYSLQQQGLDTFEANQKLGFEDDLRDFTVAAEMLKDVNKTEINLFSNNESKKECLEDNGICVVDRLSTSVHHNEHNERYLLAKKVKHDHKFKTDKNGALPAFLS